MKYLSLFLFVTISISSIWAQSLEKANQWFEIYEYEKAAEVYSDYAKNSELPIEDYKRLIYSYFVTEDFVKCLPLVDSLIKTKDFDPVFYYIHGEASFGSGLYEQAKLSYEKYEKLDTQYDVKTKIESCDYIPTIQKLNFVEIKPHKKNSERADFTGENWSLGKVFFKEFGKDSIGEMMSNADLTESELFGVKPFLIDENGNNHTIIFPDSLMEISIPSITLNESNNRVIFTVTQPVSSKALDIIPHLYQGDFDPATYTVSNMELWEYSGYEDSTSCAFATLNHDNTILVFTKMGKRTNGADLYYSLFSNDEWSTPIEYSQLNTSMDEMYPIYNGDSILSFSSEGRVGFGSLDIYYTSVNGLETGEIKHFSKPVNSFGDDFNFVYYSVDSARFSSNKNGGVGDDDIYVLTLREPVVIPDPVDTIPTFVTNWVDQIMYFDFDKFVLKEQILEQLIAFINSTDDYHILITGHADERGSVEYNMKLGMKRAEEVQAEFIRKGVDPSKISIESKGKSEPQIDCTSGCYEVDFAKNRFAKIILKKK